MERAQAGNSGAKRQAQRPWQIALRLRIRGQALSLYLDTSGFVKLLLLGEPGSEQARAAAQAAEQLVMSRVAYVEATAAVARAAKDGRIASHDIQEPLLTIQSIWSQTAVIELDEPLTTSAASLALEHSLRAYDAVHLASALSARAVGEITFACFDNRLRAAAATEGLELLPA